MQILLNKCYGGFGASPKFVSEVTAQLGLNIPKDSGYRLADYRNNPIVIEIFNQLIKENVEVNDSYSNLILVEFDETEVTDWDIIEHDGLEKLVCVENGKLFWL